MPPDGKATCPRIVVADRPCKTETRRVQITAGGDKVDNPGEVTTKTSDVVASKLLFNSVISTEGARFMTTDINDIFLNNVLPRKECAKIPMAIIPLIIIQLYDLEAKAIGGYVYIEISKGMCGLPQASRVANDALLPRLAAQSKGTQATMDAAVQLLNCAAAHPDAVVRFHKK